MKRVLVTGAGRDIGLATARAFERAGWRMLSLDKEFGGDVVGERTDFDLRRTTVGRTDPKRGTRGPAFFDPDGLQPAKAPK